MGVKEGDYLVRQLNHLLRQIGNPTLAGEIAESVQAINNQDTLPTLPEDSVRQPQSDNPSPSKGLEKFAEEDTLEGMLEEMPTHIKVDDTHFFLELKPIAVILTTQLAKWQAAYTSDGYEDAYDASGFTPTAAVEALRDKLREEKIL